MTVRTEERGSSTGVMVGFQSYCLESWTMCETTTRTDPLLPVHRTLGAQTVYRVPTQTSVVQRQGCTTPDSTVPSDSVTGVTVYFRNQSRRRDTAPGGLSSTSVSRDSRVSYLDWDSLPNPTEYYWFVSFVYLVSPVFTLFTYTNRGTVPSVSILFITSQISRN